MRQMFPLCGMQVFLFETPRKYLQVIFSINRFCQYQGSSYSKNDHNPTNITRLNGNIGDKNRKKMSLKNILPQ